MSALAHPSSWIEPKHRWPVTAPRFYRPELDVMRLFAFLCVFVHHGPRPSPDPQVIGTHPLLSKCLNFVLETGGFGMCLFFFLSSFLITELLQRERLQTGTVHVRSFYMRRILRIWPLYFTFIAFCVWLSWHVPSVYGLSAPRVLAFLLLAGNWYVFSHGVSHNPIEPLWSISLEEQYYLVWPMLSKVGGPAGVMVGSLLLIPIALISIYLCSSVFKVTTWWNGFVHFLFFAMGAIVAVSLKGRTLTMPSLVRLCLFASGVGCWFCAEWLTGMKQISNPVVPAGLLSIGYILVALGCTLLFFAFYGAPDGTFPRWLTYLGKISFGLYVFHRGCYQLSYAMNLGNGHVAFVARYAMALLAAVGLAVLSYECLEKPFLRLKQRFTFISSRAA